MPAENEDLLGWELYEEAQEGGKEASERVLFTKVVCKEPTPRSNVIAETWKDEYCEELVEVQDV